MWNNLAVELETGLQKNEGPIAISVITFGTWCSGSVDARHDWDTRVVRRDECQ